MRECYRKFGGDEVVTDGDVLSFFRQHRGAFALEPHSGALCYTPPGYEAPRHVLPPRARARFLYAFHDAPWAGHQSTPRVLAKLRDRVCWPGMSADVAEYVRGCLPCALSKATRHYNVGQVFVFPVHERFVVVHVDILGSFIRSVRGYKFILVIIDRFSRYCELALLADMSAETVALAFYEHLICEHSVPQEIITDRGSQFRSELFFHLNRRLACKQTSSAMRPQTNGAVERVNRVINSFLRTMVTEEGCDWDFYVSAIQFAMNTSLSRATGTSAFQLVYDREPRMPPDNILTPTDITAELQEHRTFEQLLTERLQRWTHRARDEQRRQLDQRIRTSQPRMRPARLRPGDLVIFETGRYKPGPTKLQRQFSPDLHVVLRQVNANLVEIRDTDRRNLESARL